MSVFLHLEIGHGGDSLVVTMTIDQCVVKCILVYTGSSVNILFKDTFTQMDISWEKLLPYAAPLVGFIGKAVKFVGKITLPVSIGDTAHMIEF